MTADAPYAALRIELRHTEGEADVEVELRDQGPNPFTREEAIYVLSTILNSLKAGDGRFMGQPQDPHATVVTEYLTSRATAEDIHDRIDAWHRGDTTVVDLHTYLGMTWEQYRHWVEKGELPQDSLAKNQSASPPADVNRSHS